MCLGKKIANGQLCFFRFSSLFSSQTANNLSKRFFGGKGRKKKCTWFCRSKLILKDWLQILVQIKLIFCSCHNAQIELNLFEVIENTMQNCIYSCPYMQKSSHAYFCTRMYKNLRYKNKRETRGVASQFDDCLRACARMDARAGMYVHTFIDIFKWRKKCFA